VHQTTAATLETKFVSLFYETAHWHAVLSFCHLFTHTHVAWTSTSQLEYIMLLPLS